jgi:hypothetical protein
MTTIELTIQKVGLKRNTTDKFYTCQSAVELCLNLVQEHITIAVDEDLIIEPSAGNGAFISHIHELSNKILFYDIEPDNEAIIKQDFLELDTSNFTDFPKVHCIGNPPFGRQSSLAIQFIKKACEFCDTVSFILPKSFKKPSLKKSFPLNFHLVAEIDLPEKSFLVNDREYNVDTVFQIWIKQDSLRELPKDIEPCGFVFTKMDKQDPDPSNSHSYSHSPDISFRRVGVYAGKIDTDVNKSVQSHYFIKFTNGKSLGENLEQLKQVTFAHNNTVGPKSISKQELIAEFNKYL